MTGPIIGIARYCAKAAALIAVPTLAEYANAKDKSGDDSPQAAMLSFRTGGELYVLLPKGGGAAGLMEGMASEYFGEIARGSASAVGKLLLPRFKPKQVRSILRIS